MLPARPDLENLLRHCCEVPPIFRLYDYGGPHEGPGSSADFPPSSPPPLSLVELIFRGMGVEPYEGQSGRTWDDRIHMQNTLCRLVDTSAKSLRSCFLATLCPARRAFPTAIPSVLFRPHHIRPYQQSSTEIIQSAMSCRAWSSTPYLSLGFSSKSTNSQFQKLSCALLRRIPRLLISFRRRWCDGC